MPLLAQHQSAVRDLASRLFADPARLADTIDHPIDGPFLIAPHRHRGLLQLDLLDGVGGTVQDRDGDHPITGLTALATYPDELHGYRLLPGEGARHVYHLKLQVGPSWPAIKQRVFPALATDLPALSPLVRGVQAVCRLSSVQTERSPLLLARLAEVLALWPGEGLAAVHPEAVEDERNLDAAVRLIEQHPDEPPSVEEMARAAHLSVRHFSRRFRMRFGCTPLAYVTAYRLDRAKTLLLGQRLRVHEVADELGFSSVATFSRWFRQHVGVPPSQWQTDPATV